MATMKLFRCLNPNCKAKDGGDFESEQPICPQCRTEANDEKFGHVIVRRVAIHFDPPSHIPGFGLGVRACDHSIPIQAAVNAMGIPNPFHGGTGVVDAVTCQKCKQTAEWQKAKAAESEDGQEESLKAAAQRLQAVAQSR